MKKMILWALGLLLLLPVVGFIAVVAINQFDEPLDPQAAAWGQPRPASVPEAENGYYALLGLGAPLDADPAAFARAWLAEARAAAKENRVEKSLSGARTERALPCDPFNVSCLDAALRALQVNIDQHAYWSYIYNPIGKFMLVEFPAYDGFALRLHDLDAFNRLAGLRLEAMLDKTTAEQAAEFAAKSDARFHHPYTGKPMAWDAAKGRFHFTLQGETRFQSRIAFSIDNGVAFVVL